MVLCCVLQGGGWRLEGKCSTRGEFSFHRMERERSSLGKESVYGWSKGLCRQLLVRCFVASGKHEAAAEGAVDTP